jgi:hypothetical protein
MYVTAVCYFGRPGKSTDRVQRLKTRCFADKGTCIRGRVDKKNLLCFVLK